MIVVTQSPSALSCLLSFCFTCSLHLQRTAAFSQPPPSLDFPCSTCNPAALAPPLPTIPPTHRVPVVGVLVRRDWLSIGLPLTGAQHAQQDVTQRHAQRAQCRLVLVIPAGAAERGPRLKQGAGSSKGRCSQVAEVCMHTRAGQRTSSTGTSALHAQEHSTAHAACSPVRTHRLRAARSSASFLAAASLASASGARGSGGGAGASASSPAAASGSDYTGRLLVLQGHKQGAPASK